MRRIDLFGNTWRALKRDLMHCACGTNYYLKESVRKNSFLIAIITPDFQIAFWYRIYRLFYLLGMRKVSFILYIVARFLFKCDIHPQATIDHGVLFMHGFGIVIGPNAIVGRDVVFFNGVSVGKKNVGVYDGKMPIINDRCVIGTGAKLLGNIEIGFDVVIGANSVVLCDIPDGKTAVGSPARFN